jgi:PAS domain S-box-containing protein
MKENDIQENDLTAAPNTFKDTYTATEVLELQKELLAKQKAMEERMWVDSTLSKFDDILRMNYDKSLTEFSEVVIYHISKITNSIRGSFYTLVHQRIEATGCYACTINSLSSRSFEIGEGLIGQSVKSQEILYLTDLPQQNLSVMSASGAVSARAVIIVPLIFNEKAYGVVELLYIGELEEKYHSLLSRLSRNIATMLQSIQSNSETKRLLHDSIQQAEALRSAEEELCQNMEEIQTIREDIERKNDDLQLQINLGNGLKKELETRIHIINKTTLVTEADLYGTITYVNEKFCEVTKYHADEVVGKPHSILRHPYNPKELFKELWTTIKSGRIFQGTYPNKAKDGSTYWVEATIAPILDENGQIVKYIGVRYDITERVNKSEEVSRLLLQTQQNMEELRAQEEELRQNLEEMQSIQEEIERNNKRLAEQVTITERMKNELETRTSIIDKTTIVTEADLYGNITYVNDKFCLVTGFTPEEVIGKPHKILRHPGNPKELFKELWTTIKAGKTFQGTYPNLTKDGSTYWVEATIAPVFDEKGNIIKYIGVRYDITERVQQEEKTKQLLLQTQQNAEEIRAQEEELRQNMEELAATQEEVQRMNKDLEIMLNAADECLFIVELSTDSKLIKCNNKFLAAMGYMDSELLNGDYRILMDSDEYSNYLETLSQLQAGKIVRKVVNRYKKNGELVHLDATYYPVMNKYGQLVKIFKLSYNITDYLKNADTTTSPLSFNNLTDTAIVLANRKGKTTWISPYFTEFTGYTLSEMLNKTAGAMLQGGDTDTDMRQAINKAIAEGTEFQGKILNYAKNGKRFWCYMHLSPIIGANQQIDGYVAVEQFEWID